MSRHICRRRSVFGPMGRDIKMFTLCLMVWVEYGNCAQIRPSLQNPHATDQDSDIIITTLEPHARTIQVSWMHNDYVDGVHDYKVTLLEGKRVIRRSTIQDTFKHTFFDLKPCTQYSVTVQRIDRDGHNAWTTKAVQTASEAPPAVSHLSASITARRVDIDWLRPSTMCEITSYAFAVYKGQNKIEAGRVSHGSIPSHPTFKIDHLEPNTTYLVEVIAVTAAGRGQPAFIPFTTGIDEYSSNGRHASSASPSRSSRLYENTIWVTLNAVSVTLFNLVVIFNSSMIRDRFNG